MIREDLKKLGDKILILENLCQQGIDIEKNTQEINNLISNLSFEEILEIGMYIEENVDKIKKF